MKKILITFFAAIIALSAYEDVRCLAPAGFADTDGNLSLPLGKRADPYKSKLINRILSSNTPEEIKEIVDETSANNGFAMLSKRLIEFGDSMSGDFAAKMYSAVLFIGDKKVKRIAARRLEDVSGVFAMYSLMTAWDMDFPNIRDIIEGNLIYVAINIETHPERFKTNERIHSMWAFLLALESDTPDVYNGAKIHIERFKRDGLEEFLRDRVEQKDAEVGERARRGLKAMARRGLLGGDKWLGIRRSRTHVKTSI